MHFPDCRRQVIPEGLVRTDLTHEELAEGFLEFAAIIPRQNRVLNLLWNDGKANGLRGGAGSRGGPPLRNRPPRADLLEGKFGVANVVDYHLLSRFPERENQFVTRHQFGK